MHMARLVQQVLLEAAIVGLILSGTWFAARYFVPLSKLNDYKLALVLGVVLHVVFEATGLNLMFCRNFSKQLT